MAMSQDSDFHFDCTQNDNPQPIGTIAFPPDETLSGSNVSVLPKALTAVSPQSPSHLKLVISRTPKMPSSSLKAVTSSAISDSVYRSAAAKNSNFTAEVRKRSPYDFLMVARDPFHYLDCELPLTFEENQEEGKKSFLLVCRFPTICDDALVDFIEGDEDLLGIIMIQFQMQILENLFAFCTVQNVGNLIIRTTEEQFKELGIYQNFIKHVDKIPTKKGISIEMAIPVHSNSLTKCDKFMDDMTAQFRKTMWQDQSSNPAIRDYLKTNVRLSIIA